MISIMRTLSMLALPTAFLAVTGCEQKARMVYVLESPQSVTLTPSASALKVQQGETVVLKVARSTSASWRQIPRDELRSGQCWVYRPPPETEAEVADNVEWQVVPENAVTLNTEFRLDHTRIVTMVVKGTIRLTPLSAIKCEPDRIATGPPIEIEVY